MNFDYLYRKFQGAKPDAEETEADKLKNLADSILDMSKSLGEVKENLGKIQDTTQSSNPES